MITLSTVDHSLEVILAGAPSADLPITGSVAELTLASGALNDLAAISSQTNGTTAVAVVAAPAAGKSRVIKSLAIPNVASGAVTLTVRLNDDATMRPLFKVVLQPGDVLSHSDAGWQVFNSAGKLLSTGEKGDTGSPGGTGAAGADGNTILYGTAAPTTEGVDGDFYIRTTTNFIYGPKASGTWPGGTSLVGATGAAGADGADGNTILYGTAAPTTEGVDGDFYIRTTTNFIYGPKASGTWPSGTSLVGPTGAAGADGADATNVLAINTQTASYTLVLGDGSVPTLVDMDNASAMNLTVPPNADVALAVGTQILARQKGAGPVTIVAGSGVTINSSGTLMATGGQFAIVALIKLATNTWALSGDRA
jgi:hypothetical protein